MHRDVLFDQPVGKPAATKQAGTDLIAAPNIAGRSKYIRLLQQRGSADDYSRMP